MSLCFLSLLSPSGVGMRLRGESSFHGRCLLHLSTETRCPTLLSTLFFGGILRMLRLGSSERATKFGM